MQVPVPIVGSKYYTGAISKLASMPDGTQLTLAREPNNKYDANAVAVHAKDDRSFPTGETQLGHIPREVAKVVAPQLDAGLIGFTAHYLVPNMVVLLSVDEDSDAKEEIPDIA